MYLQPSFQPRKLRVVTSVKNTQPKMSSEQIRRCFACGDPSHTFNMCLDIVKKSIYANNHTERICRYYAKRDCRRVDCPFLHHRAESTMPNEGVSAERNDSALASQQARELRNEHRIKFSDSLIDTNQTFQRITVTFAFLAIQNLNFR